MRARIEIIWNWAKAHGYVHGDNPAQWKGALQSLLPSTSKLQKTKRHPAMPYSMVPDFMRKLKEVKGVSAMPADRIKAGREHRVPLTDQISALLKVPKTGDYIVGRLATDQRQVRQKPLSNMAMAGILKLHGGKEFTVHGFRSSFRDWATEKTQVPREICEHALAHQLPNKVEAAYLRTDWLEQRRTLMQQ